MSGKHIYEMDLELTFFFIKKSLLRKIHFHNSAMAYIKLVHLLYLFKSSIVFISAVSKSDASLIHG